MNPNVAGIAIVRITSNETSLGAAKPTAQLVSSAMLNFRVRLILRPERQIVILFHNL